MLCPLQASRCNYAAKGGYITWPMYYQQPEDIHGVWQLPWPSIESPVPHTGTNFSRFHLHIANVQNVIEYPSPSRWETAWNAVNVLCRKYWWVSYIAATVYSVGVWVGPSYMKSKSPYNLRGLLIVWNLFMAMFYLAGMVQTIPQLALSLHTVGLESSVCQAAAVRDNTGTTALWLMLFAMSKYMELIDSLFLVLSKREVSFLHWLHHCTLLVYSWHAWVSEEPIVIFLATMGFTVHGLAYFYFFASTLLQSSPPLGGQVAFLQILHTLGCASANLVHLRALLHPVTHCDGNVRSLSSALVMYASHFFLLGQLIAGGRFKHCSTHGKLVDTTVHLEGMVSLLFSDES